MDHPVVNIKDVLKLIEEKEIAISMHSYSSFTANLDGSSYPLFGVDWCVMVPLRKEIPRYLYIVRPLTWKLWILLFFTVIGFSFVLIFFDWILQDNKRLQHGRFGEAILTSIAFLVRLPLTFPLDSAHWKRIIGAYIPIMILGFIISNYYTTLLASFITTTIAEDDINTIDDLIAADIPIMMQEYDAEKNFTLSSTTTKIHSILKKVSPDVFDHHCNTFNQSFAYLLPSDKWNFLAKQQMYSYRPLFKFSEICVSKNTPVSFLMEYDSELHESLKHFILKVFASGLDQYWDARDFEEIIRSDEIKKRHNAVKTKALRLPMLFVAWLLLACGFGLGAIALVGEFAAHFLAKKTTI